MLPLLVLSAAAERAQGVPGKTLRLIMLWNILIWERYSHGILTVNGAGVFLTLLFCLLYWHDFQFKPDKALALLRGNLDRINHRHSSVRLNCNMNIARPKYHRHSSVRLNGNKTTISRQNTMSIQRIKFRVKILFATFYCRCNLKPTTFGWRHNQGLSAGSFVELGYQTRHKYAAKVE